MSPVTYNPGQLVRIVREILTSATETDVDLIDTTFDTASRA